jgi:hypothetical protein
MLSKRLYALMMFLFILGCQNEEDTGVLQGSGNIRWADSVIAFSTEYNPSPGNWSAYQTLDTPNTYPDYGDIETAWTSFGRDVQREYLELGYFASPEPVRSIAIFETYNPGFVDTVYVKNPMTDLWEVVYQDSAYDAGDTSRIFIINFPETSFNVSAIRIAIEELKVNGWNEIDAVAISSDPIPAYTDTTFWAQYLVPSLSKKSVKTGNQK